MEYEKELKIIISILFIYTMKILININDLKNYKSRDLIPLECSVCKNTFYKEKHCIQGISSLLEKFPLYMNGSFCSKKCSNKHLNLHLVCHCKQCGKETSKTPAQIKKSKNAFCSQSCAAFYNNSHKTIGTSRSKLEVWIESQLKEKYSELEILYNDSNTLGGLELDIYIPSLKLAFELNGIFHYEPIFGDEKLKITQGKDQRKFKQCIEKEISLCIIDVHNVKYLKKERDQKFLDIITKIINESKTGAGPKICASPFNLVG